MMLLGVLLLIGFVLAGGTDAQAAAIVARSCSKAAVQDAIDDAADGDTVVIPNGSCAWSSGIALTKQITLRGASATGVTITHRAGGASLLTVSPGSTHRTTIANLRFMPGSATGYYLTMNGGGMAPLMHDVYFNVPDFQLTHAVRWNRANGVIWRMTMESTDPGGEANGPGSGSGGLLIRPADNSWNQPSSMGVLDTNGDRNVYIEDSEFRHVYNQAVDCDDDCRVVIRHSTVLNSQFLHHGTTSLRGGRQSELYDNAFRYEPYCPPGCFTSDVNVNRYMWVRAGTTVITDNSFDDLTSSTWGDKVEIVWIAESLTRAGAGAPCETTYPGTHWPGFGGNGASQASDPMYFWNNTGTMELAANDHEDGCGNGLHTVDFVLPGRDYFTGTPKPGYAKYTYPHPLRAQRPRVHTGR